MNLSYRLLFWSFFGLFSLSVFAAEAPSQVCLISNALHDYADEMGLDTPPKFLKVSIEVKVAKTKTFLLTDQMGCGARGCEYILYEETAPKCFKRLGEFSGAVRVLPQVMNGYHSVEVTFSDAFPSEKSVKRYSMDLNGEYREHR